MTSRRKPVAKPRYRFCWECGKALYAAGKYHRRLALNAGPDAGVPDEVFVHADCVKAVKATWPDAAEA